jgi:hypothetical protein
MNSHEDEQGIPYGKPLVKDGIVQQDAVDAIFPNGSAVGKDGNLYTCEYAATLDALCGENHDPSLRRFADRCYRAGLAAAERR